MNPKRKRLYLNDLSESISFFTAQIYSIILINFLCKNKDFDRQYTEFGGWKGRSHRGFLPTGETASFIIAGEDITNMVRRCAFIGFTKPR